MTHSGGGYSENTLERLRHVHEQTVIEISRLIQPSAPPPINVAANREALRKLADRIQPLLKKMYVIPDELMTELAGAVSRDEQPDYKAFKYHVEQFDYKNAMAVLERLIAPASIPSH
ncbi:hypothetical protein CCP3SC15_5200002 [Gammaproteobacteria bacterium]